MHDPTLKIYCIEKAPSSPDLRRGKKIEYREALKNEARGSLLPAKAQRTAVPTGIDGVAVDEELRLTLPHLEAGAVEPAIAAHRARQIDGVLIHLHDLWVMEVGKDAHHRGAGEDIAHTLVVAMIRATVAVPASIIVAEPEGLGGIAVALVEGNYVAIRIPELRVFDTNEPTGVDESRTRISEAQQRKLGIVRTQTLGDLRDAGEVRLEGLGAALASEALVPEALGLNASQISFVPLRPDSPGGETGDEFLHFGPDAGLAASQPRPLNLMKLGHVANVEKLSHGIYLHLLTSSQQDQPLFWL